MAWDFTGGFSSSGAGQNNSTAAGWDFSGGFKFDPEKEKKKKDLEQSVQQLADDLFVDASPPDTTSVQTQNSLLDALNSMSAESSTPFISPRMDVVNANLDDYQKSIGDSERQQMEQLADLLPAPEPKEGIYTRMDKAYGGFLPGGVPFQRDEGFPGMENFVGGGPEAPPVFEDDPVMKSLAMGWGDVAQSAGGAAKWMGKEELGNKWVQSGQKLIDANQLTPGTPGEHGTGLSVVRSLPFTASLIPAALAGAAGGTAAAGAAGLGTIGTAIAGGAGATLLSRPFEALAEAGGTYNDALAQGWTEDQAAEAAKSTFLKNLPLAATDFLEIGTAFLGTRFLKKPLGKAIETALESKFGRNVIDPAIKIAMPVLMEGEEENIQQIIQQQALGDKRGFIEQYMNPTEAQMQARRAGQVMGGALGGVGAIANIQAGQQKQPVQEDKAYTTPPLQKPDIAPVSYSGPVLGNIERPATPRVEPPPATPPDALSGTESGPPSGLPPAGPASGGEVGPAGKAPHMAGIARAAEMPTFEQWAEKEYGDYSDFSKGMMETAKAKYDRHIAELAEIAKYEAKDIPNEFEKIYYRGEKTGETKKISTGLGSWDNNLFVANSPKSALAYGDKVERIALKKNSKVLIEGSKEYKELAGNKKYKKPSDEYVAVLEKAKEQGYDVVEFSRQTDIGTVILNENSVVRNYLPESTTPPPPLKTGQAGTIVPAPETNVPQMGDKPVEDETSQGQATQKEPWQMTKPELAQQKSEKNPAPKQELAGEGAKTTGAQPPVPAVAGNKVKQQAVIVRHPDGDGYAVSAGVDRWISGGGGAFGGGSIGKWNTVEGAIKGTSHLNKKDWDIVVSDELKPGAQQDSSRDTADSIRKAYDAVTKMYMDKYGLSEAPEQPILAAEVADEWGKRQGMKPTQARKSFREAVAKLMEEGTAGDIVIGSVRDVNNSLGRITVGGRDIQLGTVYVRTQKAETGEKTEKPAPEKKKGPTPDRVRNVFRGKKGAVRVVFPDAIHADLFGFVSKMNKAAKGEGGDVGQVAAQLRHWLGLGEKASVAALAQEYHKSVMDAVKDLPKKSVYKAERYDKKAATEQSGKGKEVITGQPQPPSATMAEGEETVTEKQPWQMTREEFRRARERGYNPPSIEKGVPLYKQGEENPGKLSENEITGYFWSEKDFNDIQEIGQTLDAPDEKNAFGGTGSRLTEEYGEGYIYSHRDPIETSMLMDYMERGDLYEIKGNGFDRENIGLVSGGSLDQIERIFPLQNIKSWRKITQEELDSKPSLHQQYIQKAISKGKPVSSEVLAEYGIKPVKHATLPEEARVEKKIRANEQEKPPEAEVSDVPAAKYVYDSKGRKWEVLDDTSDRSKIKVRSATGAETWLGRKEVTEKAPESEAKAATESREQPLTPESIAKAYIADKASPEDGSWEKSADGNYAERFIKPLAKRLSAKGWSTVKELKTEHSNIKWMQDKGFVDTAWDKKGTPYYALKGTALPEWLTKSDKESDMAKLPDKGVGQKKPQATKEAPLITKEPWQMAKAEFLQERPAVEGYRYHGSPDGDLDFIDPYAHTQNWQEGIGFYTTNNRDAAKTYAEGRTTAGDRKGKKGTINYVEGRPKAVLDMDAPIDKELWKSIVESRTDDSAGFADELVDAKTNSDGYKEAVHFLRDEHGTEAQYSVEESLVDKGITATAHMEGRKSGKPHQVFIHKTSDGLRIVPPKEVHRRAIEKAVKDGKNVPPEVMRDYSDLGQQKKETPAKAEPVPVLTGKTVTAKTERGTSIEVQYAVVSADDLIASHNTDLTKNEAYPEEIQPRQRERAASEDQINRIAANLEPEFLGESPKASEGAPIVGPDLVVESGNGRVIALQRVFRSKKESASRYKEWLVDNAEKFGIDKEALNKVEKPVLVRIRKTEVDRVKFAQEANEQSVASMSATEQAKVDAEKLDSGILKLFVPSETGEIHRLANADFIRAFMDKVVGPAEKGRYVTADGVLSQEGITRIKNAIFAKAYGDVTAIATLAESTDNNVKNITNAMLIAAPKLAKVKEGIESGNLHDLDISSDIAAAMKKLSHLRDVGDTVENYLNQVTMFEQELSDIARSLLKLFNDNKRHTKRIAGMLNNYADGVRGIGDPKQVTMFSRAKPTKEETLIAAIRKVEKESGKTNNQTSLFQDETPAVRGGHDREGARGVSEEGRKPEESDEEVVKAKAEKPKSATAKEKALASQLRKQAATMQKTIDAKRNPGVANQNPTARRARIAAGMAADADRLENIQSKLVGLADAIENGTLPETLAGIRTRAQVEALMSREFPKARILDTYLKDILKYTEGMKGSVEPKRIMSQARMSDWVRELSDRQLAAMDTLLKLAEKKAESPSLSSTDKRSIKGVVKTIKDQLRGYKTLKAAGIDAGNFAQARRDLMSLGEQKPAVPAKEQTIKTLERGLIGAKIPGYFPTPKTVVAEMLDRAEIEAGMKVLEPSAGKGNIADLIREKEPESDLSVIEVNSTLRDILEAKEYDIVGSDFLEHEGEYDRIVMNPPFEKGQDVDHVKHAYELLKPGGRLVSIMSESPFFRGDKKYVAFREWLEEVDGASEKLPEKSFTGKEADRQTGVAARMVVIEKPGETTGIDALREKADAALANNRPGGRGEPSSGIKSMLVHSPQKTSIKQVAAGLRIGSTKGIFKEGMTIVDMGGGLWEEGTKYLAEKGITNLVYDPYARTKEHNDKVIETLEKNGGADAAALNNVLNVIPTTEERADVLKYLYQLMKSGGQAVITVYEGNKSGKGAKRVFGDGTSTWQENRRLATYEEEIRKALPGAELQKRFGAFILTKPAVEKKPWKAVRSRVGKVVGSDTYIHKSALDTLTEHQQSQVKNAQKHIPADFGGYEIIKVAKDGSVSFIKSPDWDTAPEPRVGDSIKIAPDKALSITKGRNKNWQIYHHKWMFVKDDYAGFDVEESKARSEQWKNSGIPEAQNLTRIGNNDFWQQNVASKLGGKTTKRSAGSHAREKVQGMANPVQPPTPKSGAPAKNTIRRRDIIRFLNAKLAPIRTGRFRNKSLGIFKVKPEVIRTRLANDLPTISHEIGHYLDKKLELSKNHAYDQELITLGQPQSKKSYTKEQVREEGVAEFIRLYLTEPQQAEQEAPNYFAAFEDVLDIHEDIKDILLTAQRDIELWYSQPAEARVAGAISVDENNARKMSLDRLYSLTVDELDPLKRFTAQLGGKDVAIDKNPFLRAWLARGWNGKAETLLHYGVMDKNGKKTGKSLDEVLAPVKDELDSFRNYAVAKHSLEVTAQGKHTGILDADAEEVVKNAPQKYQDVLEDLVEYQDALLNLLVESGVMKAESVTTMREMYPNYVPFYRVFDEDVNTVAAYMSKGGFANLRNPVKAMKGSMRDIVDPIESIIKNTYTFVNIAERNAVGRSIVELAEGKEGMGRFVEKVDAMHNVAKENILTVYRDGKAEKYQLDPDLYRATLALDREASNILIKILSYPASWLRAGATLSPDFMIRNPVRDQFSAFINSKYGYIPGIDLVKGIFHAVKKDELYWQYQNSGAAHSSLVAIDRDYLQKDIRKFFKEKTTKEKIVAVVNPGTYIEMLRALSELGEYGTRLGEFAKGVKKGASFEEAALSARDMTLDFGRVGSHMKHANRVIAFMNATIQGSDKIVRQFKANPKGSIIKTAAAITLPSIILFLLNHDDDRYKELPQWQKDMFWIVLTKDHIFRIPKPFELGILFGTVPERALAWAADKDPKAFRELGKTLKDAITPGYIPTAMLPIIEVWANKSFFTSRPIVPEREKKLDPRYQFGPYTTETTKAIGNLLNWSPRKIESFLRGYTGGLGLYTIKLIEGTGEVTGLMSNKNKPALAVADYPVIKSFMVKQYASPQSVEDFYAELNELEKKYSSTKQTKQLLINQEEYDRLKLMRKVADKLSEIRKAEREIQSSKELTPAQKKRALENADKLTANVARAAMGKGAVK